MFGAFSYKLRFSVVFRLKVYKMFTKAKTGIKTTTKGITMT